MIELEEEMSVSELAKKLRTPPGKKAVEKGARRETQARGSFL